MKRTRRRRRKVRQEALAPWVAMIVILAGWALAAWVIDPDLPRAILVRPTTGDQVVDQSPPLHASATPPQPAADARRRPDGAGDRVGASSQSAVAATGTSGTDAAADTSADVEVLRVRSLLIPVTGVDRRTLISGFDDRRGSSRTHEALDIMAPRGTPVVATDNGTIVKLFASKPGGTTIYQFDPSGTYCYYYAHLDRYAPELTQGDAVERGQTIGYVGSTGNASPDAPHLHFAIFRLGPEQHWWEGEPVDSYKVLH